MEDKEWVEIRFWEDTWCGTSPLAVQFLTFMCFVMNQSKLSNKSGMVTLKLIFRINIFSTSNATMV
jgi:hypothetical protein